MNIHRVGTKLLHADRGTDRHGKVNSRYWQFCERAQKPPHNTCLIANLLWISNFGIFVNVWISCTVSFGSAGHVGSYAAVCNALNVAMTQTTRVARDMIRPQTRHSRTAARIDGRLDNSTELHTWSAASTHFRRAQKVLNTDYHSKYNLRSYSTILRGFFNIIK
jgi:hypothetical protein